MQSRRITSDSYQPTDGILRVMPAAITDTGCERELNEDRYAVIESKSGVAWIVADGMGGVTGGELAAQLAIDAMRRHLESTSQRDVQSALQGAILEANRVIVLRRQNPLFASMGTTIVGVMFRGNELALAHAGDSRAYLVRSGMVVHLTQDHTLVQEMVSRGELTPEEALRHPQAHVLTRCLGAEPGLKLETTTRWIKPSEIQDTLILMSDGLYTLVSDSELGAIVTDLDPQRACVHLVELAKARGGFDNITVAIIPIDGAVTEDPTYGGSRSAVAEIEDAGKKINSHPINTKWLIGWWVIASMAVGMLVSALFTFMFLR